METTGILYVEAEAFVKSLETFSVKEVGSLRWFTQHEYIQKLNMQAVLDASVMHDETVKELLVSFGKIPVLIHELILIEVWKHKVFTILCQLQDFNPKNSFQLYMVIYHESTVINLLQTILFHKDSCEAAGDSLVDLVDYCHRKLTLLASKDTRGDATSCNKHENVSSIEELKELSASLEFGISLAAVSVLCHITGHTNNLSVMNRMLCTHNMPCVLVQLIVSCPWSCQRQGEVLKYIDGSWQKIPDEDYFKMTKLDGQVWISLYNLLLNEESLRMFDFNSFNRDQLSKLRTFLTDVLIDQMPILVELQRFLTHLACTEPAPPKKQLLLELIPKIWMHIVETHSGKWKAIAKYQAKETFNPSESDLAQLAKRLGQIYNWDVMENFHQEKTKCGSCGKEASKRCSRCQTEWYCHRKCQVQHWPKHKKACQLMERSTTS
ncbi:zinc finger MYND domain-containing protein 10 isoform X1 [Oryzias latipes]|uniref:Zinc finger MYND domain-containing protein 10 n=1 Tax=Oryzias latipes TaxID=8090 RepID=A0A3B3H8D7_ORYLA|nr:zinc finger MYND domain-containing protein 10 isoform X1 [Oryzias latipes]